MWHQIFLLNKNVLLKNRTLKRAITPGQIEPEINGNESLFNNPQILSAEVSTSDAI